MNIYSVSGLFTPIYLPEDFFHSVLERIYNNSKFYLAYEDKAFMPLILDSVKFPDTIFSNVNGYYFDGNGKMNNKEEAIKMLKEK